jgi:D-alanyl-D-alanine carboxypeptidase
MKKAGIILITLIISVSLCLPVLAAPRDDQRLTLVNPWNNVPENWQVDPVSIGNGHRVDRACYDDLMAMLEGCREAGHRPVVKSSYRTQATQKQLYENKVRQWIGYGYDEEAARKKAATIVAVPGTSEHQLGWAVDIVDDRYHGLNEKQATMPAQIWLMEHCWEYGFILRYPVDKSEVTGIIYEPWHYRYVGKDLAAEIHKSGLCLEEYFASLTP